MSTTDPTTPPEQPTPDQAPSTPPAPADPPAAPERPPVQAPEPDAAPEQPAAADEVRQALEDLRARQAELEARLSSGQLTATPEDEQLRSRVAELRQTFAEWPVEGGNDLPHPWDLRAHGLPLPGVTRDFLPPGPNELAPIVIAHRRPLLTSGMAGEPVLELAELLGALGYPSSISRGENPTFAFDDSLAGALAMFKRDYGVAEDPSGFPTGHDPEGYVGAFIWEALLRLVARKAPDKLPLVDLLRIARDVTVRELADQAA